MLFLLCIVVSLSTVYTALLLYFWRGSLLLKKQRRSKPFAHSEALSWPSLSVVVPLRNEEKHALATLNALANQNYPGNWEVWCVNDRSTDNTAQVLENFTLHHPSFHVLHIPQEADSVPSPKKRALEIGFSKATGDILLTTDADCIPPTNWFTSMASQFSEDIGIVQGPKEIMGPNSPIALYQKLETLGFVSVEAATFALGKPMLASAPSLAYRRSLFDAVGGFSGLEHLVSGDDDMLVHKMVQHKDGKVRYNMDPNAAVRTPPVDTWKGLLIQRARWASNGSQYEKKSFVILLLCLFSFYLWLLLGPILAFFQVIPWTLWVVPFLLKYALDSLFLYSSAQSFQRTHWLKHVLWAEWINIPVVVLAAVMGHFGWYKWK